MLSENLLVESRNAEAKIPNFAPAIHTQLVLDHRERYMKLRILTTAVLTFAILIHASIGSAQKRKNTKQPRAKTNRWHIFVSPDGDFTSSFPEKPSRESDGTGPASPITIYSLYKVAAGNSMMFHINFRARSGDPDTKSLMSGMTVTSKPF
jgi:hypothetical protein